MDHYSETPAKKKSGFLYVIGVFALLIIGYIFGSMSVSMRYPILKEPTFKQFNASYTKILNDYLEGAEPENLINGAARGMLASLEDPYSQYLVGEQGEAYTQSYEGEFYGIGANMRKEEELFVITSVIKDTPAERGGLLAEDVILAVDGKDINGMSFQELLGVVRGEEGSSVTLKLQRAGEKEPLEITLKRAPIPVHTVSAERLEDGIGHITISRFAENTAKEFKEEIAKLEAEGPLKGLMLDMRSNPGGLLTSTIEIASVLIPKDKKILDVVYKNERQTVSFLSHQEEEWKVPTVVLVNGQSASASEVMAAALKESAGAQVIGETTYGKGVVQGFRQFPDGSVLSLTEAQWKTPGGTWINKEGVAPDYQVSLPEYANVRPLATGSKMQRGSYGDNVITLQIMLRELGYGPLDKEGVFDEQTEAALKAFQSAEKLEPTGVFNDKTGYRLVELLREKLAKEDTQLEKGIEVLQNLVK
ncbi:PDZ domain-containing protein [Paenibacillus sp. 1011MAR3C5]|uniref:S41 family peptidase n=1 Tax=Paenibacillus sp. 1011MAR3C5 TaxID=1675787 RepID=UPI000E6C8D0A|nr:S41 family peptidase [Paenibacillus sp. 1011MAR3C5]RJE91244.1 PDZ domain-containing protein [Paenibacillus sp. 1011MAR3C5]